MKTIKLALFAFILGISNLYGMEAEKQTGIPGEVIRAGTPLAKAFPFLDPGQLAKDSVTGKELLGLRPDSSRVQVTQAATKESKKWERIFYRLPLNSYSAAYVNKVLDILTRVSEFPDQPIDSSGLTDPYIPGL